MATVETRLKHTLGSFDELPGQLKSVWKGVVDRLRNAFDFAMPDELKNLQGRVGALEDNVDKLVRDRVRNKSKRKAS